MTHRKTVTIQSDIVATRALRVADERMFKEPDFEAAVVAGVVAGMARGETP